MKLALIVVVCMLGQLVGCGPISFVIGVTPGDQRLKTKVVFSDQGQYFSDSFANNRIAMIDVSGMIMNANRQKFLQKGENPVSLFHEQLEKTRKDHRVKALIIRLNTPGGTVTASDAMYRELKRFKKITHMPVVILMMDVAASGGYYLACAGDKIVAYPTTVTGSIGVMMQTISIAPALARWGISASAITSGPNKDAGSPFSTLSAKQRAVFQSLIDDFYQQFLAVVRQARPQVTKQNWPTVTDGRVFSGKQALAFGLVDQLGDLHDAFDIAKSLSHLKYAKLQVYHRPLVYVGSPYAQSPTTNATTQINMAQINLSSSFGGLPLGFYYLWKPVN